MSKRFFSQLGTFILAFGMAFLVWVAAIREADPIVTKNFSQRVPVKIIPPRGSLFVVNQDALPTDVQVSIRAPESVWQNLTLSRIRATLDLSSYDAGFNDVPIRVELLEKRAIVATVIPSEVGVELEPLAEKSLPVTINVLDSPAQGYYNRTAIASPGEVTVKGSAAAVAQVATILAEISIDGSKETMKKVVSLSARDNNGNIVLDVELDPSESLITVPIEQRFGYRDVSVKANVQGQPASGYWVSSISVDPATVTLVGGPSVLKDVAGFVETTPIDITGATADVVKRVPLNLPPGASVVVDGNAENADTGRSVLVTVGVSALTGGRTVQVGLTVQGVRQDLQWQAAPDTVEVILSGPLPILQDLQPDDITAIVDVFGLSAGVYRLQPEVVHPDGLVVSSLLPDTIEITLSRITQLTPTVTPTPRETGTPTFSITPTPGISATLTPMLTDTISSTVRITDTTGLVQPAISPLSGATATATPTVAATITATTQTE